MAKKERSYWRPQAKEQLKLIDEKITYYRTFKTASESIFSAMRNSVKGRYKHQYVFQDCKWPEGAGFSFTCCRHPHDRFVSLWCGAIQLNHPNPENGFRKVGWEPGDSFEVFINKLCRVENLTNLDVHLSPQSLVIPSREMDFLLRFETLQDDWKKLQEIHPLLVDLPHKNKTNHRDFRTFYSPETWEQVAEFYKVDFEKFGYDAAPECDGRTTVF